MKPCSVRRPLGQSFKKPLCHCLISFSVTARQRQIKQGTSKNCNELCLQYVSAASLSNASFFNLELCLPILCCWWLRLGDGNFSSGNNNVHQIGNPTCSDVTCYLLPYPYVSTHYVHYRFTAASRWKPLSPPSRQSSCHICFCFIQPIEQQQQCREPLDCWESLSPRSNTAQGTPSHTAHGMAFTFFDVCAARKEETSTQLLLLRTQKP